MRTTDHNIIGILIVTGVHTRLTIVPSLDIKYKASLTVFFLSSVYLNRIHFMSSLWTLLSKQVNHKATRTTIVQMLDILFIKNHLSNAIYPIPFIKYHLSNIIYQISFIKYHLSNTIYQIPFIKYHLSNTFYQIPFIKYHFYQYHLSNTIYQIPFIK